MASLPHPIFPSSGFTLLEFLVALAILAILMTLAVPSLQTWYGDNLLATQLNELRADLALARAEALMRGRQGVVCKTNTGRECIRKNAHPWTQGWIVFVDRNGDENFNDGEVLLRHHPPLPTSVILQYRGFPSANYLTFNSTGSLGSSALTASNGTFILCYLQGGGRALVINSIGRIRVTRTDPDTGQPLACL